MYSCDTSKRHPRRGDTGREIAEKLGQTAVVEVLNALEAEAAAKAEAKQLRSGRRIRRSNSGARRSSGSRKRSRRLL